MFERRHCHPLYFVERAFRYFVLLAVWFATGWAQSFEEDYSVVMGFIGSKFLIILASIIGAFAIALLLAWIGWRCRWVSAENDTLIYEYGVLFKRRLTIPFSKINTIDLGRNIFQRIFGTCRLKLDTGAIIGKTNGSSEMDLVFSVSEAEEIREYILGRTAAHEDVLREAGQSAIQQNEPTWLIKAGFGDFFMYGLSSSSVGRMLLLLIAIVASLAETFSGTMEKLLTMVAPQMESMLSSGSAHVVFVAIMWGLAFFALYALIVNIWSIVTAAIRFYNFRVAREGDNVVIRYGLVSLKSYTMPVRNIHAVIVRQNLFQQLIHRCCVEIVSIGYGDEKSESSLLFPIIALKRLPWLIGSLLPEYSCDVELNTPTRRCFRFHFLRPVIWGGLFIGAAAVVLGMLIPSAMSVFVLLAIILELLVCLAAWLSFRHTGIGWNESSVAVRNGGFNRSTHYIRVDAVQSLIASGGPVQRRHGVATYRIDYHAPALRSIAVAKHLETGYEDALAKAIDRY